eukprot:412151-Pelagomonas_calceolata.AAC.4
MDSQKAWNTVMSCLALSRADQPNDLAEGDEAGSNTVQGKSWMCTGKPLTHCKSKKATIYMRAPERTFPLVGTALPLPALSRAWLLVLVPEHLPRGVRTRRALPSALADFSLGLFAQLTHDTVAMPIPFLPNFTGEPRIGQPQD